MMEFIRKEWNLFHDQIYEIFGLWKYNGFSIAALVRNDGKRIRAKIFKQFELKVFQLVKSNEVNI